MTDASTIPSKDQPEALADMSSPHTEVYHNVKIGNCPALRAPKVPTGTTLTVCGQSNGTLPMLSDLAKSPMLLAPERVATYLRANPEVTVALMSGIVRPAMLKELSRAARGVVLTSGRTKTCTCQGAHAITCGKKVL